MKTRIYIVMAAGVFFSGLVLAAEKTALATGAQQPKAPASAEDKAWNKVNALERTSLEQFLKEFPNSSHSEEATRYVAMHQTMSDIKEGKTKLTNGITNGQLGPTWQSWKRRHPYVESSGVFLKRTDTGTTMGIFSPVGGGATPTGMAFDENQTPMLPTGTGSIVGIKTGGIKMHYLGLVFETPDEQTLIFGVIADVGLVHLSGAGKVTLADGKVIEFKPTEAQQPQAPASVPSKTASDPNATLLKTEVDKVSYIIGTQIARNFKSQDIEVNLDSLLWGLKDGLSGKELVLTQEEMKQIYSNFQQQMMAKQAAKRVKEATENLAKGKAFLEENKTKEGVKVLPSGLQYKVIKEGTGKTPTIDDRVKTHYQGTLIDGTEFDSSYKRNQPVEFAVTGVIKGWTEALQLMKEGDKWELYVPANLAYDERGRPGIPPNAVLIFQIELLEVVKQNPEPK